MEKKKFSKSGEFIFFWQGLYSKVGDLSQRWPKGSLFDSYYTKV